MVGAGKKLTNIVRGVALVSLTLTVADGVYQGATTGELKNSTLIDGSISAILLAGSFATGPAAPIFWTANVVYSGVRLFWGNEIDNWIDN